MAILEPVDQQATTLDVLFRTHRADLVALCRRRLGPGPDAEDAAHEAMLRAWRARSSLDADRDPWPWLATIAGNVCIDVQRRRATVRSYVAPRPEAPLGPEDHAVRGAHDGLVRDALDQLSPGRREALLLREVEDWDYGRIAAHQRKSPGSVRTAVTRARQELRDHVELLARSRDQWPLAGLTGGLLARTRARLGRVRADLADVAMRGSTRLDATFESAASAVSSGAAHVALGGLMTLSLAGAMESPAAVPVVAVPVARSSAIAAPLTPDPSPASSRSPAVQTDPDHAVPAPATPAAAPALATPALAVLGPPAAPPAGATPGWSVPLPPIAVPPTVLPNGSVADDADDGSSTPLDALLPLP